MTDLIHPGDREIVTQYHQSRLRGDGTPYLYSFRITDKHGDIKWLDLNSTLITWEGSPAALCFATDITDRKVAEDALRESQERYRMIFENAPLGILHFDHDGVMLDFNDKFVEMIGAPREKLLGFNMPERQQDERMRQAVLEALSGNTSYYEGDYRSVAVGKVTPMRAFYGPVFSRDGRFLGAVGIFEDVTERKAIEEALRFEREQLLSIFESINEVILVVEPRTYEILYANKFTENLFGKEIIGGNCYEKLNDFDSPCEHCANDRVMDLQGQPYQWEYFNAVLNRNFLATDRLIRWPDGRNVKFQLAIDITERKQAEEALSKQAEFMTHLMEAIPVPVFFKDVNHVYVGCNHAFAEFLGLPKERIVGKPVFDVVFLETAEIFRERDETLFRNPGSQVYTTSVKRYDGSIREVIFHKATYGDPEGPVSGLIGVILDITDRKILEQQLLHAQKMEAIGTLAGGIAHDFNNLLQVTLGYSELLLAEKREDDPEYADLSKILQSARSGAELVQRLLTFSRKVEPKPIPLNLNRRILQVEKLLRRTIPKMIDIQMDLSNDLAEVHADPTQVEQILMNLAVNARDAMPDRGKLTVRTKNVTLDDEYCRVHAGAKPGEYVLLKVSDTGHGMDKATIERIFEPFYTTKELGRGTGLGLAMVYGIVKQNEGYITCESEVGRGTTFNVYLPAIESQVEPDVYKTGVMPTFGTETILLVDDEEFVRDVGARILIKAGYNVLTATNSREALDLFEQERTQISLVILDLIMPEMGGKECLKELRKINPQLKILIASGLSADPSTKESFEMETRGLVSKPFRMKELLRQVRKVLDES